MNDVKMEFAEKGLANITSIFEKRAEKEKLNQQEKTSVPEKIRVSDDLSDMVEVD